MRRNIMQIREPWREKEKETLNPIAEIVRSLIESGCSQALNFLEVGRQNLQPLTALAPTATFFLVVLFSSSSTTNPTMESSQNNGETVLVESLSSMTVHDSSATTDAPQQLPPHRSHDPENNLKRSDPFQFGSRFLSQEDNVFEFNAWDHVETDDAYKEYAELQYAKQRGAPVSDFDKSMYLFSSSSSGPLVLPDDLNNA
jgi:hypothetical protein